MTNFEYLLKEPQFKTFAQVAVAAEKITPMDPSAGILNCRRAMEFAIKWMYSVDKALVMPYQDNLVTLLHTEEFRGLMDESLWKRLDFIRRMGNQVAHSSKPASLEAAKLCLKDLYLFLDFVAYCYAKDYEERPYDESLVDNPVQMASQVEFPQVDLKALMAENAALKEELTRRREAQAPDYVVKPLDLSEFKTRKIYVDAMLRDAGWTEGKDWLNEVELSGMPNDSGIGYADYVLYDDAHRPLAVIEAKRTCVDVSKGRQQAKLYADLLAHKYHRRPVVFLTNGFDTRIVDGQYPERRCAAIWSKRDLEKWFNLRSMRTGLQHIVVDKKIAGRYYQEAAVKAVCDSFDQKNRRKALLVMATGSGKTRTVIALCKVLLNAGWIRNILFLADRTSLVLQAKRSFVNLLPDVSCSNITEDKDNYGAHCIFSTYQTLINLIDEARDEEGKVFSCGHFDLVICDEAHRSIYNKYKDIFNYFDAPLVGLTATPKDEIDRNTYQIFELEDGVPTYGYDLAQAVKDGFLVDFQSVETTLQFLDEGIVYDDLSDEEKEAYEKSFKDEDGNLPPFISAGKLNTWVFNADTIRKVLATLMEQGLRIDHGEKLGKTIIFAKNHAHAEKILEVFHKEYPHLGDDYAKVIDNTINYAQSAIDEFSDPNKYPQIAISVDMLDTGIDVPEVLNLVFFKKVLSKAKFWQMIGRGNRLCPGLIDGKDKEKFYIFDFCRNFAFFRMNKGKAAVSQMALQGAIFYLELSIVSKLQTLEYQTEELQAFRAELIAHMVGKVQALDRENFAVRQHIRIVDRYAQKEGYQTVSYEDIESVKEELVPLLLPDDDDASIVRFDALLYGLELASLKGKTYPKARKDLLNHVQALAEIAHIPAIQEKAELIRCILHTDYLDRAGIEEWETIRKELRNLMPFIHRIVVRYDTDFADTITEMEVQDPDLHNDDLKNYKAKAEFYVLSHQNTPAIAKLKNNEPLTETDIKSLEHVLWNELGTKDDYIREYKDKTLGEFVRGVVGLSMHAAKEAFAKYLDEVTMNSQQIYVVNQIVEYIVQNGLMKDMRVLQYAPFTDCGSIVKVFPDLTVWQGIRRVIDQINANAA